MSIKEIKGDVMYYIILPGHNSDNDEALDKAEHIVYDALPGDFDQGRIEAESDGEEITVTVSLPVTGSIGYMKATRWDPEEWDDPSWYIPYSEGEIHKYLADHGIKAKVFMEEPEQIELV